VSALACLLAGCVVVDDFGKYWDKGFVDFCVNDLILRDMEDDNEGEKVKDMALRSVRLGKHTFLMMRDHPGDKGGNLVRYTIEGDDYITYRLNDSKREDFLQNNPDAGIVLTQETATIPLLNDKMAELLTTIADDDRYWLENTRQPYNPTLRTDCAHKPAP